MLVGKILSFIARDKAYCCGTTLHLVKLLAKGILWWSLNSPGWCQNRRLFSKYSEWGPIAKDNIHVVMYMYILVSLVQEGTLHEIFSKVLLKEILRMYSSGFKRNLDTNPGTKYSTYHLSWLQELLGQWWCITCGCVQPMFILTGYSFSEREPMPNTAFMTRNLILDNPET